MLETLAAVGEFVGGIAVLISIVYFAIQLRANTNTNKAQALSAWTMAALAEKEVLFRDPSFAKLYREVVLQSKAPEGDDTIRFYSYCIQFMNTWQLSHMQYQLGVIEPEFLAKLSVGYRDFLANRHVQAWWQSQGSRLYDEKFVAYAEELVDSGQESN